MTIRSVHLARLRWDGLHASGDNLSCVEDSTCPQCGHNPSRSPAGLSAPGSPVLPAGDRGIQELDSGRVELGPAVLVPLGMDPHSKGVFPF